MTIDPEKFVIRLIEPEDSISELTGVINQAYSQLADLGLKYVGTWQGDDITEKRIRDAECFICILDGKIISTITLRSPGTGRGADWYKKDEVARFGQFGVLPEFQRQGIGTSMVKTCENRATEMGAAEIACDTAEPAAHLRKWYESMGYRFIDYIDWEVTNYRSVIMSKTLV